MVKHLNIVTLIISIFICWSYARVYNDKREYASLLKNVMNRLERFENDEVLHRRHSQRNAEEDVFQQRKNINRDQYYDYHRNSAENEQLLQMLQNKELVNKRNRIYHKHNDMNEFVDRNHEDSLINEDDDFDQNLIDEEGDEGNDGNNNVEEIVQQSIKMPNVSPQEKDTYLCFAHKLPSKDSYIVEFNPLAKQQIAHHMLLFGCNEPFKENVHWECREMSPICMGQQQIMYAWAKNAPSLTLPEDVAFHVGGDSGVNYLVLQVHYLDVSSFKKGHTDTSGLTFKMSQKMPHYFAGIYLLADGFTPIPPHKKAAHIDMGCNFTSKNDLTPKIFPFRFRVHAHKLGVVITGYRVRDGKWTLIGRGDPQKPQAFNPVFNDLDIQNGDLVYGRCTYNSMKKTTVTNIGATHNDEMCNFYIMYFYKRPTNKAEAVAATSLPCGYPASFHNMEWPKDSDTPLAEMEQRNREIVANKTLLSASNSGSNSGLNSMNMKETRVDEQKMKSLPFGEYSNTTFSSNIGNYSQVFVPLSFKTRKLKPLKNNVKKKISNKKTKRRFNKHQQKKISENSNNVSSSSSSSLLKRNVAKKFHPPLLQKEIEDGLFDAGNDTTTEKNTHGGVTKNVRNKTVSKYHHNYKKHFREHKSKPAKVIEDELRNYENNTVEKKNKKTGSKKKFQESENSKHQSIYNKKLSKAENNFVNSEHESVKKKIEVQLVKVVQSNTELIDHPSNNSSNKKHNLADFEKDFENKDKTQTVNVVHGLEKLQNVIGKQKRYKNAYKNKNKNKHKNDVDRNLVTKKQRKENRKTLSNVNIAVSKSSFFPVSVNITEMYKIKSNDKENKEEKILNKYKYSNPFKSANVFMPFYVGNFTEIPFYNNSKPERRATQQNLTKDVFAFNNIFSNVTNNNSSTMDVEPCTQTSTESNGTNDFTYDNTISNKSAYVFPSNASEIPNVNNFLPADITKAFDIDVGNINGEKNLSNSNYIDNANSTSDSTSLAVNNVTDETQETALTLFSNETAYFSNDLNLFGAVNISNETFGTVNTSSEAFGTVNTSNESLDNVKSGPNQVTNQTSELMSVKNSSSVALVHPVYNNTSIFSNLTSKIGGDRVILVTPFKKRGHATCCESRYGTILNFKKAYNKLMKLSGRMRKLI